MTLPRRRLVALLAGSLVVLAAGLVGWATAGRSGPPAQSTSDAAAAGGGQRATSSPVPVIVPGRPGEPAAVVPPDQLVAPDGTAYHALDAWFVRMMIPHHEQALQIAALAPGRAGNPQVVAIAERITAAQQPEIRQFRAWLTARGLAESDDRRPAHEHAGMPGMQPEGEIQSLAAAHGAAFDRMFVAMMSEHHQGAVQMATEVLRVGTNEQVAKMATDVAAEQSAEIGRLRDVLAG